MIFRTSAILIRISDEALPAILNNDAPAGIPGQTGTPGIIVMPLKNATEENTTLLPGVVSEAVMQQAVQKATGS